MEEEQNLRKSRHAGGFVLAPIYHPFRDKETTLELQFGGKPGTNLSNLKNAVLVDSEELSVYITHNSTGEITDHLVMSKKKNTSRNTGEE